MRISKVNGIPVEPKDPSTLPEGIEQAWLSADRMVRAYLHEDGTLSIHSGLKVVARAVTPGAAFFNGLVS